MLSLMIPQVAGESLKRRIARDCPIAEKCFHIIADDCPIAEKCFHTIADDHWQYFQQSDDHEQSYGN